MSSANWTTFENDSGVKKVGIKPSLSQFNFEEAIRNAETSSNGTSTSILSYPDERELKSNQGSLGCLLDINSSESASDKHVDCDEYKSKNETSYIINDYPNGADAHTIEAESINSLGSQAFIANKKNEFLEQLHILDRGDESVNENDQIKNNVDKNVHQDNERITILRKSNNMNTQQECPLLRDVLAGDANVKFETSCKNITMSKEFEDKHVRLDQFNKVSPFDEVPGFKRGFSSKGSPKEKDLIKLPKLSKSVSVEAVTHDMSVVTYKHSNAVVGRDQWISIRRK